MTDIDKLVAELTLDEKAALTAGVDMWSTAAVPRLGIPAVRLTDGPNGARGTEIGRDRTHRPPACRAAPRSAPPGTPTWSTGGRAGRRRGPGQGRPRAAGADGQHPPLAPRRSQLRVLLEDPLLAGRAGRRRTCGARSPRAWPRRSSTSSATTPSSSATRSAPTIDERALREIYLRPFELAVREGGSLGVMTSYNRVNGRWCTETARAARRHPAGRVGLRGVRRHRLVRRHRHRGLRRGRASTSRCRGRPRAFGPALADGRARRRPSTRPSSTPRSPAC